MDQLPGLASRILYEDAELLVIDKPAGLAVHPGPKTPHSLEDHLDDLRLGFRQRPQPVHRLDRDTSGCLLLARNRRALKRLGALFEQGAVTKTYVALLAGRHEGDGRIDAPLSKISSREKGWRMRVDPAGKSAATLWRVLEPRGDHTLVEFRPLTGRTHQIRVHAAHALSPLVGDPVYGQADPAMSMRLHALGLSFPWKHGTIAVEAPLPWNG
ncbi:RNA pseudouridine synthase [Pacificimonas flava]|uniref:RNA pseudouridine synthase n=1 Tax=Pacificimonas flava TaxID=1234595 RepID=A0A219B118_9SPHN|nr:RNA pseudouridine synthase [Pacificimonas flava]